MLHTWHLCGTINLICGTVPQDSGHVATLPLSGHNLWPTEAMHSLYAVSLITWHDFYAVKIFLKSSSKRSHHSLFSNNLYLNNREKCENWLIHALELQERVWVPFTFPMGMSGTQFFRFNEVFKWTKFYFIYKFYDLAHF
jgi:hypothetical protein